MNIDVEVEDFFALLGEDFAGEGNVVYVAEASGKLGMGVVKAAGRIESDACLAVKDELCCCNSCPRR